MVFMLVITVNGEECLITRMQEVSLWSNVLGQLPMASLASMVSKQLKNGVPTTCTAIDLSPKTIFIA
jgi:hypothetical protein